jgi:hypothetical protein
MKDLTLSTVIAVFEEMFGAALFWGLVAAALAVTAAFVVIVVREHRLQGHRFLRAELMAPVGAIAAILFVQWITSSGFSDLGGPIDVIVLIAIGATGAVGLTILAYVLLALVASRRKP